MLSWVENEKQFYNLGAWMFSLRWKELNGKENK